LVSLPNCGSGTPCAMPQWMVWSKVLLDVHRYRNYRRSRQPILSVIPMEQPYCSRAPCTNAISVHG
jgi:hypothetical protein